MKQNFNDCVARVFKDEGGYTNDKDDSGGATNFGITIGDVRKYVNKNATPQDVRNLTLDQAKSIYQSKYWGALGCDDLAPGVDYTCFDYGVNSGLGRPRKALQTFKSLSGTSLIDAINNERTAFLKALATERPKDQKFLNGWLARVRRVQNYSHFLSAQKKDNVSGPITGTVIGGAAAASSFTTFFHQHQTLTIAIGFALAITVGVIIHYIRNRHG